MKSYYTHQQTLMILCHMRCIWDKQLGTVTRANHKVNTPSHLAPFPCQGQWKALDHYTTRRCPSFSGDFILP